MTAHIPTVIKNRFTEIQQYDQLLADHCLRVAHLGCALWPVVLLKSPELRDNDLRYRWNIHILYNTWLLHDYGKISSPKEIFQKKVLNEQDWKYIHQHPENGFQQLQDPLVLSWIYPEVILFHHIDWNGEGYPLKSVPVWNVSPLKLVSGFTRIIDTVDAMLDPARTYQCYDVHGVIKVLEQYKGTRFAETLVEPVIAYLHTHSSFTKKCYNLS